MNKGVLSLEHARKTLGDIILVVSIGVALALHRATSNCAKSAKKKKKMEKWNFHGSERPIINRCVRSGIHDVRGEQTDKIIFFLDQTV